MSLKTIQGIFKIKFQNFKTILPEFKTKSPKKNKKIQNVKVIEFLFLNPLTQNILNSAN